MASSPATSPFPEPSSPRAPPTPLTPLAPSLSPPLSSPLPEPPPSLSPPLLTPPAPTLPSQPITPPPRKPNPSNPPPTATLPPSDSSSSGLPNPSPSNGSPSPPSPSTVQPTPSTRKLPPPPPSHSSKEHSREREAHSKSPRLDKQQSSDLQLPLIIGVVVGVGLFVIIIGSVFLCCCMKKKKKKAHDHMKYYADPPTKGPQGPRDGHHYKSGANRHCAAQQEQHIIKIPPPPGGVPLAGDAAWPLPTPPPGKGWASPPPPPPLITNSSDMSSNFLASNQTPLPPPSPKLGLGFNQSSFSYDELAAATDGFSDANMLGQGGFGYVYKGVFPTSKEVAVKQLKSGSKQGEREFQAEVEIISRVHHRYLVSLIGYCIADGQRMLVYEFVPNKTLEYHLHGKGLPTMDWPTRLKIVLGSAKGLAYLHEDCHPRIIHRDVKAANILLDYNFEAKVADFGLAKLHEDNYTHVSTRVMGTFGYLAPEYASTGKLTEKSDVFSFGVMLLELITGRRPVDPKMMDDCLVDWARPILTKALQNGDYTMLVDPRLDNNYNPNEMGRMVACAAASIRHSSKKRPKMSQIVRALEGDVSLEHLNEGVKPGTSSVFSSSESSEYDVGSYNSDMERFGKMALSTDTLGSAYSAATSEYGLNPSPSSSSDDGHSEQTDSTEDQKHH